MNIISWLRESPLAFGKFSASRVLEVLEFTFFLTICDLADAPPYGFVEGLFLALCFLALAAAFFFLSSGAISSSLMGASSV